MSQRLTPFAFLAQLLAEGFQGGAGDAAQLEQLGVVLGFEDVADEVASLDLAFLDLEELGELAPDELQGRGERDRAGEQGGELLVDVGGHEAGRVAA